MQSLREMAGRIERAEPDATHLDEVGGWSAHLTFADEHGQRGGWCSAEGERSLLTEALDSVAGGGWPTGMVAQPVLDLHRSSSSLRLAMSWRRQGRRCTCSVSREVSEG